MKFLELKKKKGRTYNIMSNTPKKIYLINKYKFERLEDIIDAETNLAFKIN